MFPKNAHTRISEAGTAVFYCSPEGRSAQWPLHTPVCTDAKRQTQKISTKRGTTITTRTKPIEEHNEDEVGGDDEFLHYMEC